MLLPALLAAATALAPPHTYQGRFYAVPHVLTARIACQQPPTAGTIAAWAGVSGIPDQWWQAGVYANPAESDAYTEQGAPYRIDPTPALSAVVTVTRMPFGFYRITLNGRTAFTQAYGYVWAGVERVGATDGECTVAVTVR